MCLMVCLIPGTEIDAAHLAQVQLEMLVTGKSQGYLVYWSCMVTNIFRAVIDHECLTEALTPLQEIGIHILKQPYHSHWSFTPAHKQQISGLIGLEKSEVCFCYSMIVCKLQAVDLA